VRESPVLRRSAKPVGGRGGGGRGGGGGGGGVGGGGGGRVPSIPFFCEGESVRLHDPVRLPVDHARDIL